MPFRLHSPQYLGLAASLSWEACPGTGCSRLHVGRIGASQGQETHPRRSEKIPGLSEHVDQLFSFK